MPLRKFLNKLKTLQFINKNEKTEHTFHCIKVASSSIYNILNYL